MTMTPGLKGLAAWKAIADDRDDREINQREPSHHAVSLERLAMLA